LAGVRIVGGGTAGSPTAGLAELAKTFVAVAAVETGAGVAIAVVGCGLPIAGGVIAGKGIAGALLGVSEMLGAVGAATLGGASGTLGAAICGKTLVGPDTVLPALEGAVRGGRPAVVPEFNAVVSGAGRHTWGGFHGGAVSNGVLGLGLLLMAT
jgi:hypothetical protein